MPQVPTAAFIDETTPWWLVGAVGTPANILASTLTINSVPDGNITMTHNISSGTEYNAPLIFQRPAADINAPSESLVMNTSLTVPTKPTDGEYITATKAAGTAYDDIAVEGLQVYGNQTTAGNTGAAAYITGSNGNLIIAAQDSVYISSLFVSTLTATNVISTTATTGTSLTLTTFLSSANVLTNYLSTFGIVSQDIFTSTLTVSTLNAPNFVTSTLSTVVIDTKVTLTSTLSLTGSPTNINLGLGDVIQGLVGGAATQALGAGLGGAGLITGTAALLTGRTSGGVNSNIFQTVNGSTQLQFSTIGSNVSSIFLTVNSPNPLTTPGLEIRQSQGVAAGTYCVRSVGDPLYITNNVSSIQMLGEWVPVIQPTATIPAVAISSLTVSSINGLTPGGGGGGGITSTVALSTATVSGNLSSIGVGTFSWGGNSISGTQVILNRPTAINNTLTTSFGVFLNAGATVNSGLTVTSGNLIVNNSLFVLQILQGAVVQATGSLSVGGGGISIVGGGINMAAGNLTMNNGSSVANITNVNVNNNLVVSQSARINAISTNQISTNNINVFTINNQSYPPPSAPTQLPSTLNASTINFNGGLNNVGSAPIITNTITTTNANVNFYNGNAITAASISTITISTNTVQAANLATNTISTNIVQAAAISSLSMSTNTLTVNTINGVPYVPGGGSGIPSTLNASTINVNGGISISNGGIINNSFEPIRTEFLSSVYISTGLITADTIRTSFFDTNNISTNVIRAAAVSSFFVSTGIITASTIGTFNFSTIRGSINSASISSLSTNLISTSGILAANGNIAGLVVSSINGIVYPPPTPPLVPIGSVTIWAGGSDNGAVQTFNVPAGWLLCDGGEYQRSVYSDLFNVIGTKYGLNRPSTGLNFYVPDLTFAVPMGTPYRNYTSTIFSPSRFQIYVQSWISDFAPTPTPSAKTWKINQTVGGTLNFGTMFPASGIPLPGFPTLFVSQILSYDGYQGYIVVKSIGGVAIPDIPPGTQIIVQADGTVPQDNSGTYLYTLGSYGVESGYPKVTHNQTAIEVASHTHSYNRYGLFGSTGLANGVADPSKSSAFQDTASNQYSTISTLGVTNIGTYTAPNFLNMAYIIKV